MALLQSSQKMEPPTFPGRFSFEILRDVVTTYRRNWATSNLDRYLEACVEADLAKAIAFFAARKSRPLTQVQLASFNKLLIPVANHWFGGDQSGVAAFFMGGNPEREARPSRMPADRWMFAQQVWLGFVATFPDSKRLLARPGRFGYSPAIQRRRTVSQRLAELSLRYLQEEEALGRSPSLDEFGNAFPQRVSELGLDIKDAWATYTDVIHTVAGNL